MELSEVRKNIDQVDGEIRKLFIRRMELADQVACIKAKTEDRIYKPEREGDIIRRQTEGMDPRLVREYTALIKRIMEVSRKYQYGRTMELRDCFPFEYGKAASPIDRPVMIKDELYACTQVSKDLVSTVDSWEEIGSLIESGQADAGIGIIEEVGVGVSDELHNLLMNHGFYIFRCDLASQGKLNERMLLPDYPLEHLRRLDVPAQMKKMVMNGAKLPLFNTDELPEENEPVRIYLEGRFWGIAARQGNQMAWKALIAPERAPARE